MQTKYNRDCEIRNEFRTPFHWYNSLVMGEAALLGELVSRNNGRWRIEYQRDSLILRRSWWIRPLKILYRSKTHRRRNMVGGASTRSARDFLTTPIFPSNHTHFRINEAVGKRFPGCKTSSKSSRAYYLAVYSWSFINWLSRASEISIDRPYLGVSGQQSVRWLGLVSSPDPPVREKRGSGDETSYRLGHR